MMENKKIHDVEAAVLTDRQLEEVTGGAVSGEDDVSAGVRGIFETRLGFSAGSVCGSSSIVDDLGADSLDVVDIVQCTEDRYQIRFSRAELEKVKTVQDLCDLVRRSI